MPFYHLYHLPLPITHDLLANRVDTDAFAGGGSGGDGDVDGSAIVNVSCLKHTHSPKDETHTHSMWCTYHLGWIPECWYI